jgi:hypothetical protein
VVVRFHCRKDWAGGLGALSEGLCSFQFCNCYKKWQVFEHGLGTCCFMCKVIAYWSLSSVVFVAPVIIIIRIIQVIGRFFLCPVQISRNKHWSDLIQKLFLAFQNVDQKGEWWWEQKKLNKNNHSSFHTYTMPGILELESSTTVLKITWFWWCHSGGWAQQLVYTTTVLYDWATYQPQTSLNLCEKKIKETSLCSQSY